MKNCRPITLLPIFEKIFETVIFKDLFQSGSLPGDSFISQLLSIVRDINSSFDCTPTQDVRGTFLDISKAFDKVWHEVLFFS